MKLILIRDANVYQHPVNFFEESLLIKVVNSSTHQNKLSGLVLNRDALSWRNFEGDTGLMLFERVGCLLDHSFTEVNTLKLFHKILNFTMQRILPSIF